MAANFVNNISLAALCLQLLLFVCGNALAAEGAPSSRLKWSILGGENSIATQVECLAWRLAVETNNARDWHVVPPNCVSYVADYMTKGQYELDFKAAIQQSLDYLDTLTASSDGKDAWVFDVDETTLSNLCYYAQHKYGGERYNSVDFNEWIVKAKSRVLPSTLNLYNKLLKKHFNIFIITGRHEIRRDITEKNLHDVGYKGWTKLILNDGHSKTAVFKAAAREKLVNDGYRIVGNVGDQWGDITGSYKGDRTFKLPNPMYYS
eukprot:Gb_35342 [translate_table: standard]